MLNCNFRKISWLLLIYLSIFLLTSCTAQKKPVNRYKDKDRVSQPVDTKQRTSDNSKSLPVVKNIRPEINETEFEEFSDGEKADLAPDDILPALTLVDDRIIVYENKLEAWNVIIAEAFKLNLDAEQQSKIAACQRRIHDILKGYNELHEMLLKKSSGQLVNKSGTDQLVSVERNDISFLESECQQIIKINQQSGGWIAGTKNQMLEEKDKEIAEAMTRNEYLQVIDLYEQLQVESDQDVSMETIFAYGQALLRTGSARKAETVFLDLLEKIRRNSQLKREFQLMKLIADINFGQEEYGRAFERYVDIINRYAGFGDNVEWARSQQSVIGSRQQKGTEVRSFSELLMAYLAYNAERDGYNVVVLARNFMDRYPDSAQVPVAARILLESGDKAEAWFASVISHVNRLKVEKKYEEGLTLIEQLPRLKLLPEKQEQLRILTEELISAQYEEAEILRLARDKELQETWNMGQAHLRAKEYDLAIEVFSSLQNTTYSDRAIMQIEEAAQLAAQEKRRKAAELFVMANSTKDLEKRTELLLTSRELLLSILAKYPQSELVEKVKRNLSRIEEEIMAIDPALLNLKTNEKPTGSFGSESVPPSATDYYIMQKNGQVDSSVHTGNDLQE